MADDTAPNSGEGKTPRRTSSEVAEARAAACMARQEKKRADALQRQEIVGYIGELYYRQHIRNLAKISEKVTQRYCLDKNLGDSQIRKYLKKFSDKITKDYQGTFKTLIEKIIASTLVSSESIEDHRHNQLAILLNSQIYKDENDKISYSADPEKIAQIRLLLDSIRDDREKLIGFLTKLGVLSDAGSGDSDDWLFEIKARRAKVITNISNPDHADNGKT